MSIKDIINSGTNVQVVIGATDLREFFEEIADDQMKKLAVSNSIGQEVEKMTPTEVCKTLDVTKATLWRWQKSGYLVPFRIGRRTYYRKTDIDKLLKMS